MVENKRLNTHYRGCDAFIFGISGVRTTKLRLALETNMNSSSYPFILWHLNKQHNYKHYIKGY